MGTQAFVAVEEKAVSSPFDQLRVRNDNTKKREGGRNRSSALLSSLAGLV